MKNSIGNRLLHIGGWVFWAFIIVRLAAYVLDSFGQIECYSEVFQYAESPDKTRFSEIKIKDCVGGTSDFAGTIVIGNVNEPKDSEVVLEFYGKPSESGLKIEWKTNSEIKVKMRGLNKISKLVHYGKDVKVNFEVITNG